LLKEVKDYEIKALKKQIFISNLKAWIIGIILIAEILFIIIYLLNMELFDDVNSAKAKVAVIRYNKPVTEKFTTAVMEKMDKIRKDKSYKSVLFIMGSPGGSPTASEELSEYLKDYQKDKNITMYIDSMAASGGYYIASAIKPLYANKNAIVGSIGVIAQIPNFNKILKKNDVEFEQITAGEFKRTLTFFGENTDKAREKFREEIEQTHVLFKTFVSTQRPSLNMDLVATGEHWFATQAIEKGLVDTIKTSDDALLEQQQHYQIYKVQYKIKKGLSDKLAMGLSHGVNKAGVSLMSKFKALNP